MLIITRLWIYFCNLFKLNQMTLLYTKKLSTFSSWVFDPLLGDTLDLQTSPFKLTTKIQAPNTMEEPKDENPIINVISTCHKRIVINSSFWVHKAFSSNHCLNHWQCWKWEKFFHIGFYEVQTSKLFGRTHKHCYTHVSLRFFH